MKITKEMLAKLRRQLESEEFLNAQGIESVYGMRLSTQELRGLLDERKALRAAVEDAMCYVDIETGPVALALGEDE